MVKNEDRNDEDEAHLTSGEDGCNYSDGFVQTYWDIHCAGNGGEDEDEDEERRYHINEIMGNPIDGRRKMDGIEVNTIIIIIIYT